MKNCPKNSPQMTSKMKNLPKKMKILKKMKNLKIFRQYTKKIDPKIPPKWPQKWKVDLKNENFEKNGKFWKSSDNLEKNQKFRKKIPPNDLKTEKFT